MNLQSWHSLRKNTVRRRTRYIWYRCIRHYINSNCIEDVSNMIHHLLSQLFIPFRSFPFLVSFFPFLLQVDKNSIPISKLLTLLPRKISHLRRVVLSCNWVVFRVIPHQPFGNTWEIRLHQKTPNGILRANTWSRNPVKYPYPMMLKKISQHWWKNQI